MNIYIASPFIAAGIYVYMLVALAGHRPWQKRHKFFAWFLSGGIFWSISDVLFRSDFLTEHKLLLAKITICGFVFMLVPFCHFVSSFYNAKPRDNWLVLAYVSLLLSIGAAVFGYLPDSVAFGPSVYPHYNLVVLLATVGLPFFILAARGIYFLWRRLKTAETPAIHNQVVYLIASVAVLCLSASSNITVVGRQLPTAHIGNLVTAVTLAYAVLKGQLVDFKLIVSRGLQYAGLTLIITTAYLLIIFLLNHWFHLGLGFPVLVGGVGLAIGVSVLFYPVRNIIQRRVDQLLYPKTHDYRQMLLDFSKKASNIIKIDELGSELTKLVVAATGSRRAYLLVPDTGGTDFVAQFVLPAVSDNSIATLRLGQDNPILDWLKREGKPLFRESLDILPEFSNLWADEVEAIDAGEIELFAPLISHGNLAGVLALAKKERARPYDMSDIDLISVLTHSIAVAIENAQLHARIEKLAVTDVLTGLFNRRFFDDRITEEISRHTRYGGNLSLILFDLDNFKNYNDVYGHGAGDELLRQVARSARELTRSVDLVFRYGGDEFAILLPKTTSSEARIVGERLRTRLILDMQTKGTGVSASLGIASWPADGLMAEEIVLAADEALYHAKRGGGNGLSIFSEMAATPEDYPVLQQGDEKTALSAAHALVAAVDAKDHYTGNHSRLVSTYAMALARAAGLPAEKLAILKTATLLHDVGKIGIPDSLLNKEEKLTPEEWEILKGHSKLGTTIIGHISGLSPCLPIILYHHEQYNGSGYPDGLKGEAIPLEARILAIADAFASMTTARPYRNTLSHREAVEELRRCSGSQFDPELVKLFIPIVLAVAKVN